MKRRGAGELERAVLAAVSGASEPLSVGEVVPMLEGAPAYTTVMTTLARLAEKGALDRVRDGRAYRYQLAAPADAVESAVTARRMGKLLGLGSDRAGVLARFVDELDPQEEQLLQQLLTERRQRPETAAAPADEHQAVTARPGRRRR